jgi:hypothetical protein
MQRREDGRLVEKLFDEGRRLQSQAILVEAAQEIERATDLVRAGLRAEDGEISSRETPFCDGSIRDAEER